jgi:hypothetical protein
VFHTPQLNCATVAETGRAPVQFAGGFKFEGKTKHVAVGAEDALIATLWPPAGSRAMAK